MPVLPTRHRRPLLGAALASLTLLGLWSSAARVSAQNNLGVDIRFAQLDGNLNQAQQTGGQLTQVIIQNSGAALTAVPIVVRFPPNPSIIQTVTESGAQVGVIDQKTGVWYHTIPTLGEGRSITFVINWYSGCQGRWPLAARVGERRASTVVQFVGQSLANCPPDETAAPAQPSYYDLPWPASSTTTTTTVSPSAPPVAPTTAPFTSLPGSIVGGSTSVATTVPGQSVAPTSSTTTTTTIARPPVTRAATVPRSTVPRPTTSVEIVCKTVGGRRYCGPKSSVIKPGQQKPREVKPPTTKKKK
jgi:hypothetical protein